MNEDIEKIKTAMTKVTGNFYKTIFLILSALTFIVLPILSFDAGLTDDERLHCDHGTRLMNYYIAHDTMAGANPIDANGEWRHVKEPDNWAVNINLQGGDYDMFCAFVYRYITSHIMGEFESKHFLLSLMGALLFVLIGLITYRLTDSWAAALMALIFGLCCPRLVGHSFDNPKDIPLAAFFAFSLYQIILALQENLKWKWYRLLFIALSIIFAIDCRVGGLMLIFYFGLFTGIQILNRFYFLKEPVQSFLKPAVLVLVTCILAYLGCSLLWPFAARNPFLNILVSLKVQANFNQFNSFELFEHRWINNFEIPWYFIPRWYYITFPLFFISGLVLFFVAAYSLWRSREDKRILYALMVVSGFLPMILIALQHSNVYDDGRHLFFTFPSLIPLATIGWYYFFKRIQDRQLLVPAMALCGLMAAEPMLFMIRNHPHEVMYFSPQIGGVKGAFKAYEMDYWGFSVRAAGDWIDKTDSVIAKGRKTRVRLWYGEHQKLKYYADKSKNLEFVFARYDSPDWDYWITLPVEAKFDHNILYNWPPAGTIHQIMVDDVPLCAIVKNPMSNLSADAPAPQPEATSTGQQATPALSNATAQAALVQGLNLYNAKDFNKAVVAFKTALRADSMNQLAYNNLVASYNLLHMYKDAAEVGSRGMKLFPTFALLKNNLAVSLGGLKGLQLNEQYYTGLSYNYYVQGDFAGCVRASELLTKLNPKSAVAYNNICSANNALGNYRAAKVACEKALALAPGDKLVLNNLAFSKKGLGEK